VKIYFVAKFKEKENIGIKGYKANEQLMT